MEQQIYQWIILGILVAFVAFDKAKKLFSKSNPGNNYPTIMENKTRSLMNKQAIDAVCKNINGMKEDNKEDHKIIFNKLDKVFERIK